jgi:peroxiredoxin family protein
VNVPAYRIAAVMASGEPERLYSGLSLLVSAAADGQPCAGLATFRGLHLLLHDDLLAQAENADSTPVLSWQGRETFARSLVELRDTALELDALTLYACAASVETMSLTSADVEGRLDGVMSTPRFLRETAGAQLVFV